MRLSNAAKGDINTFASTLFFALAAVLVKLVSSNYDGYFISVCRFVTGALLCFALLAVTRQPFKVYGLKPWILRGITGSVSMVMYFMAIQLTSSGRATLISNTSPVFVAIFGAIFFGECIHKRNIAGLVLCLAGMFIVFYDGNSYSLAGDLLGLGSAILAGFSVHFTKMSGEREHPAIVYLSACLTGLLLTPFCAGQAVNLTLFDALLLFSVGAVTFAGQLLFTYGIKHISATRSSTITYFKIPVTIVLGMLIVHERPGINFFIGTCLVILGLLANSGLLFPSRASSDANDTI